MVGCSEYSSCRPVERLRHDVEGDIEYTSRVLSQGWKEVLCSWGVCPQSDILGYCLMSAAAAVEKRERHACIDDCSLNTMFTPLS